MSTPQHPITLYTFGTPNGRKASIALEELGLKYNVYSMNLRANEQKEDWYLKINPNGRIPAIVDHSRNDFNVFESGAILLYLTEHYDKENKIWPKDSDKQSEVIQWIMFQMSGVGPMQGQAGFFNRASEKIPFAIKRYEDETKRLYTVLETRLTGREYLAAGQYTIADIATFTWAKGLSLAEAKLDDFPNVKAWVERIAERPEVQRGLAVE